MAAVELPATPQIARYRQQRRNLYGLIDPLAPTPAPGVTGSYTYSVATLADRPAVASVPDSTLVFVRSQRSWYKSDLANAVYRREPIADPSWQTVPHWVIDPAGSVENTGAPGSPIPVAEFVARLPVVSQTLTIDIVAGATVDRLVWQMLSAVNAGASITVSIAGIRTLGPSLVVATSSDETATLAPRVDAGAALTVGALYQVVTGATAGATAGVTALVAGTNYETSPWRTAGGARAAPPGAGDTIALITLPVVTAWAVSELGNINVNADSLQITNMLDRVSDFQRFRTCVLVGAFAGAVQTRSVAFSTFSGCVFQTGANFFSTVFVEFSAVVQAVNFSELVFAGHSSQSALNDTVCHGRGIIVRDGGVVNLSRVGVMSSTGFALSVARGGLSRLTGTYYGSLNAGGTTVDDGGVVCCDAGVTPTCAAAANELIIDGEANQLPALTGGAAVPAAAACDTWAKYKAAPFNANVYGRLKLSRVVTT